ncbi:SpoIID/LytB domain-containing protein [Blautia producta]|uniref:SpoIID/LytB domain-containing protein n=1 Tax=Blautia producta TaxID=33035 RepID=UPI0031B6232C
MLIILLAVIGILIVWQANRAGVRRQEVYRTQSLQENMIKENERASAGVTLPASSTDDTEEKGQKSAEASGDTEAQADDTADDTAQDSSKGAEDTESEAAAAKVQEPEISVLLMTDGYKGYTHQSVKLQFHGSYHLLGSQEMDYADGETLELTADSPLFGDGKLELQANGAENRATLLSVERQQGNPAYRGNFTVYQEAGGLRIVNTLPLEAYLYGVVPSEMPASYHIEALKAQAVCARTYACVQMQKSALSDLGADVDDSVAYQVYQNGGEAAQANDAVDETKGEILESGGQPITAYYFSTSSGKTSTDEVWEVSAPASYLKSVDCSYDAQEPWHQWSIAFSAERMLTAIQAKYAGVQEIHDIDASKTSDSGAVMNLTLDTDQGVYNISNEYDIRALLSPDGLSITRQDGSVVKGSTLLPSAYFTLEEQRDENNVLTGYVISGGGYGHGVGLSQNGAKGMAEAGMSYQEILAYFYKDVELSDIAD